VLGDGLGRDGKTEVTLDQTEKQLATRVFGGFVSDERLLKESKLEENIRLTSEPPSLGSPRTKANLRRV
jgi:hypothetical protein